MAMREKAHGSHGSIQAEVSSCDSLPVHILSMILAKTTPCDIGRVASVSRKFAEVAKSDLVWDKWLPLDYRKLAENLSLQPIRDNSVKELYCLLRSYILAGDGLEGYGCDFQTGELFQLTYTVFTLGCINVPEILCFSPEKKAKDFSDYCDLIRGRPFDG